VLEVGSGGYNAALIAEIVGPEGAVVTVDINPWVTERASRFLAETSMTASAKASGASCGTLWPMPRRVRCAYFPVNIAR
jgi:protein-L-isoaspartate O-methyltransferase